MKQNLILVTMSPIAKIFMKRFRVQDEQGNETVVTPDVLLDDPDRIWREERFIVPFTTVSGNIDFISGIPNLIEDQAKRDVLVGGRSGYDASETDWTGLVMLDVESNVLSGIFQVMNGGKAPNVEKQVKAAMTAARQTSHERCMRAARRVFDRMMNQRALIEEAGQGKFTPSVTEALCAIVMEKEASEQVARKTAHAQAFEARIAKISQAGDTKRAANGKI